MKLYFGYFVCQKVYKIRLFGHTVLNFSVAFAVDFLIDL